MTKPAGQSLRETMPKTAEWVDRKRNELGAAWVNDQIRAGMAGEPGHFYAIEAGRTLGTPFPCTHVINEQQRYAVLVGAPFAGFIAKPLPATQEPTP